uniref:Uncharacterized protein n=1 Tax=Setaria viridis TaxID=4556 RepID=A0A4U6UXU2_SETVI|nr:hypothetical protein SEVIR_4G125800v2 [Setaria viridis]
MGGCGGDANRVPSSKPVEDVEARMTKPTTSLQRRSGRQEHHGGGWISTSLVAGATTSLCCMGSSTYEGSMAQEHTTSRGALESKLALALC